MSLLRSLPGLAALILPAMAAAQSVRGTVTESSTQAALSGVIVQLVDSTGQTVGRVLSSQTGEYRLSAPRAGTYRLRTQRIGFRPVFSEAVVLSGSEIEQEVRLTGLPISLDTVHVAERNVCGAMGDSAGATFAIWEQARAALTAAQLTSRLRGLNATVVTFERTLNPRTRRVEDEQVSIASGFVTQPWRSAGLQALRRDGYVVADDRGWLTYHAPGLDVLLSDAFIEDHCFRIARSRDRSRIGIAFEPTRDRREIPEIHGTIWLDRATSELRHLEFGYANVSAEQENEAGGEIDFVRMRDGGWAVSRWNVRMPALEQQNVGGRTQVRITEIKVAGGDLSLAVRGSDTLWARPPISVAGTVKDSLSGEDLAGVRVALKGTLLDATTDRSGRFTLTGVLPGAYTLEVRTASLDSIGAVHQSSIVIADANDPLHLRVPSGQQILASLPPGSRTASFTGVVVGDSTGRPIAEAEVALPDLAKSLYTSADGTFRLADIPPGRHRVVVRRVGYGPVDTTFTFAMRQTVTRSIVLERTLVLDTVSVRAMALIPSFEEHKAYGRGHFLTRADLEKMTNRPMSAVLGELPGVRIVPGKATGAVYIATRRRNTTTYRRLDPPSNMQLVQEQGYCLAQVYLNGTLAYRGEPNEPPFDINTLPPDAVEAVEYYGSPAQVPLRYAGKNVECGVVVIHTRRARR